MSHPPGPWTISYSPHDGHPWIEPHIAHVYESEFSNLEQQKANATLIAASPELLAFAKGIYQWADAHADRVSGLEQIKTAALRVIAKAEGKE